ncbi:MAG: cytidylate kinase-like family protein, partial [Oscillospiraceae bacterium]|nr:cytidylate kinase-like family protein [Oscillospiraceae bacterium]
AKNLFNFQAKTIEKLADKESCIIIGRCADHVLKDRKNVLRVFIWADRAHCIENVMRINSVVDKKEAVKQIERIDKERSTYYKNYTGHSWDDVRNYDLCLNTGDLGFERCVDIISYCAKLLK